ncbi:DAK2 domain-containing protein [Peptoniphilus grossensis]|uniref:DAK2 domain-containing protein n=1 Tax=Peptoniphilus grossensis TaxID=1465756 RepID=A0ABU7X873_9FIRM|nr:DAK2 domain-containing protein [Peptoniphilus grossensis]MDU5099615.1 DAK2 domain-containing protein [Peptoniphilus grossensis]MDU7150490.1 DAK2 domain-containing protein [Peptoniphilus grossensis]
MEIKKINGPLLKEIFKGAVNYLISRKEEVNALNVFPVPDGDTGTNMSLTSKSALKQIDSLEGDFSVADVSAAAARGALMGARGNSGVILSQLLRGFSEGLEGLDEAGTAEIAHAFKKASETTYKAVMKPIEGTILTVGRETADFAIRHYKKAEDLVKFLEDVIVEANKSLDNTPNLLEVLKEADVVDAGGKGLVVLLEGGLKVLKGEDIADQSEDETLKKKAQKEIQFTEADKSLKYGYCTEFIINTDYEDIDSFREKIAPLGDCLLVVGGGGSHIIKVHVHTNDPGIVLQHACELGLLQDIKIDNMRYQHREVLFDDSEVAEAKKKEEEEEKIEEKDYSFITVSMGDGMTETFKSLGVDYVVAGGQTMNPSTEDFLKGIDKVGGKVIYLIPNNSNIILSAEQARDISDRDVIVIPSKSVPQGIAAMLAFNGDLDKDENKENMIEAIGSVIDASVTYAVRDTTIGGKEIHKDDIIGIAAKEIITSGKTVFDVVTETVDKLMDEDISLVTLFYGEDVKAEDAEEARQAIEEKYPDIDIDVIEGDQPIYYYILSLE